MLIGYTMTHGERALDPLLAQAADILLAEGLRVVGMVQVNHDRSDGARCDMDAVVLPDGPVIRISQSLGPAARGCRLDPEGLERAVAETGARLGRADLLLINKFGKQEAGGRGMRPLIAEAAELGLPILMGVNALNLPALQDFAGGLAQPVEAELNKLCDWMRSARGPALETGEAPDAQTASKG